MERVSETNGVFTFSSQERVIFGKGFVKQLPAEIDRLGGQRAFVITGRTLATKTGILGYIQEILGPRCVGVFFPISQHVPRRDVIAAASQARDAKTDVLVSLGGGSAVDGTKAVALCLAEGIVEEEQLNHYRVCGLRGMTFTPQFRGKSIMHIALTTTLSAAEFTSGFGITDELRRVKDLYRAPHFVPRIVILDPELTLHTPGWLWASTGIRAVDHAIERLCSPRHQPLIDALCFQALRYLFRYLPLSTKESSNLEARLFCQLGAWMSTIGFTSVGTGISHAIGHQLGGRCNVPHGQTSCIILPHAMEFNLPFSAQRLALIAEAAGIKESSRMTAENAAIAAIAEVKRLIKDLGCPSRLREAGVKEADFPMLAQAVMEEAPLMENPRSIRGIDDIIDVLRRAW
jgi:alcohol dehydrogenase class IV